MATNEYLTIDDLTYKPIKNAIELITAQGGVLDEFTNLVDRANNYYEDLCQTLNVDVADIQFPIPHLSKELLNHYVTYIYASESRGQVNMDIGTQDVYSIMEVNAYKYYRDGLKSMNADYVSGEATADNRVSISFGRMVR
jgi:hypothetical protein